MRYCFLLTKDCMHNEVWGCAETLPNYLNCQNPDEVRGVRRIKVPCRWDLVIKLLMIHCISNTRFDGFLISKSKNRFRVNLLNVRFIELHWTIGLDWVRQTNANLPLLKKLGQSNPIELWFGLTRYDCRSYNNYIRLTSSFFNSKSLKFDEGNVEKKISR